MQGPPNDQSNPLIFLQLYFGFDCKGIHYWIINAYKEIIRLKAHQASLAPFGTPVAPPLVAEIRDSSLHIIG